MNESGLYILRSPADDNEWRLYHGIRRKVLFENRGLFGIYDENRADDHGSGRHHLLLLHQSEPIGVIRIDVEDNLAIFRRVAIRNDSQRQGHGRMMLWLAEGFALKNGTEWIRSFVNPEAVGFYERCGFKRDPFAETDAEHVLMYKWLS